MLKLTYMKLAKVYNPKKVENKIYNFWSRSGFFNPDRLPKRHKKPYTIVIPPPNITGELHMGHALNATVQDILIRWKRLQGYKTLWLPGTDHAGIAAQNVVEKELKKEGKTRFDLGKELFIKRMWQWMKKYGNIIINQFKKMGVSCDWSRTRFTLDKEYIKAVKEAFSHYYKKGWIYRGKRVINWCPRCQTGLSDLELEYKEEKGKLYYIKYLLSTRPGLVDENYIMVATTRPETMLGDSAVAVNPKDLRYKNSVNKKVILPLVNREIPIIADRLVDPKFGTGAVKVTPAHDLTDYEMAQRHNLEIIQVIDEKGKITKAAPLPYQGLNTFEARKKIIEDLKNLNLLEKIEDYVYQIPRCYRCDTIIELIPSEQWFLKMNALSKMAMEVVKAGEIKFVPKNFEKVYFDWLKNIKDWCISRQIWWGHKIPAWHCQVKMPPDKKMGFHESVVPQVLKGKISTWRLRNHNFKPGDVVAFKNSQTGEIFGYGTITKIVKTTVGKIDLKDKSHYKTYKNRKELIKVFKHRNPDYEVNENTPVFAYAYAFRRITAKDGGCGRIIISKEKPKKCPNCKSTDIVPDADVLDTWFSSALWPFATLGWPRIKISSVWGKPKKISDLDRFYPTDVLSTDREIINLWVARMIFSGMEFLKKVPFKTVYIHPTILTKEGQRMSKSLGTGIDPINLIEKYGADANRFGIAWQITGGQDIRFVEDNIAMGKKFCNKLWNAVRFVLLQIKNNGELFSVRNFRWGNENLTSADRKILKALEKITRLVNQDLEKFRFGNAAHKIYNFFWHDFCDEYIENAKKQLAGNLNDRRKHQQEKTRRILLLVLLTSLKLLHPFIPFITEEIYQRLPLKNKKKFLMIEEWPG